jgi:hypothetical protein
MNLGLTNDTPALNPQLHKLMLIKFKIFYQNFFVKSGFWVKEITVPSSFSNSFFRPWNDSKILQDSLARCLFFSSQQKWKKILRLPKDGRFCEENNTFNLSTRYLLYVATCRVKKELGSMLWSQFSAIFDNFLRNKWRFSQKPMLFLHL